MSKKKLKKRIKELEAGNLALADINMSLCRELKVLSEDLHYLALENKKSSIVIDALTDTIQVLGETK